MRKVFAAVRKKAAAVFALVAALSMVLVNPAAAAPGGHYNGNYPNGCTSRSGPWGTNNTIHWGDRVIGWAEWRNGYNGICSGGYQWIRLHWSNRPANLDLRANVFTKYKDGEPKPGGVRQETNAWVDGNADWRDATMLWTGDRYALCASLFGVGSQSRPGQGPEVHKLWFGKNNWYCY